MSLFFKQTRVGKGGKHFTLVKFQTMDNQGNITRPFLRKSGLDELPQIWNIIKGDMAVFGPRPEVPERDAFFAQSIPLWIERYKVKPGLIGISQVKGTARGPNRFSFAEKAKQARQDAAMIRFMSFRLKLKILMLVPSALFAGQTS